MSTNSFRRFEKGIVLEGQLSNPSDNIEGSLFFNSDDVRFRAYIESAIRELITADQSQTLTNKTVDADSNSISNIDNGNIKSGAAIDASKIADGSVSSAEFQYLSGVTSNIQTQLNSKISDSSTNTLTNKTIDGDDNTITDLALTSLKIDLAEASNFLVRDVSGNVVSNSKAVPTGAVVGTSDTQNLSNKSLTEVIVNDFIDFDYEATPTSPTAGGLRVYVKNDDKLYKKTSAGVESEIGASAASPTLVIQSKTTTYTALITDDLILCDTSGGSWVLSLPTAASASGHVLRVKKTTSDTNTLTVDADGTETIDGSLTYVLVNQNRCVTIVSNGTNWNILDEEQGVLCSIRLYMATNHGSTNTCIPRWTTVVNNTGNSITYTDSVANGTSFTINESGLYTVTYMDVFSSPINIGFSLNSSQLTTPIQNITPTDRLVMTTSFGSGFDTCIDWSGALTRGDVIRPHTTTTTSSSANESVFIISKIR